MLYREKREIGVGAFILKEVAGNVENASSEKAVAVPIKLNWRYKLGAIKAYAQRLAARISLLIASLRGWRIGNQNLAVA